MGSTIVSYTVPVCVAFSAETTSLAQACRTRKPSIAAKQPPDARQRTNLDAAIDPVCPDIERRPRNFHVVRGAVSQ